MNSNSQFARVFKRNFYDEIIYVVISDEKSICYPEIPNESYKILYSNSTNEEYLSYKGEGFREGVYILKLL